MKTLGVLNAQEILKWIKLCTLYVTVVQPTLEASKYGLFSFCQHFTVPQRLQKKNLCSQLHHMTLSDLAAS